MKELFRGIQFAFLNFATPVIFYVAFEKGGAKLAIGFAILTTLIQVIAHRISRARFSPFFVLSSGFTVGFGLLDLFLASPRFFRLEPFFHNLVLASILWGSLGTRYCLMQKLVFALPARVRPERSEGFDSYLRKVTWVWIIYLYSKAFFFLYLAYQVDLGKLIILRSVVGGGSLWALILGEMAYRKFFRKRPKFRQA